MISLGQLILAVSIPTIAALIGVVFNQVAIHRLSDKIDRLSDSFNNFRVEMTKEIGTLTTRIAVIETKLGIAPPTKPEPAKEVAA